MEGENNNVAENAVKAEYAVNDGAQQVAGEAQPYVAYDFSGAQGQGQTANAANVKKKKGSILTWIVIAVLAIGGAVYFLFFNYVPKFSVDGMEFSMKSKVKDILAAGFIICDSNGKEVSMDSIMTRKSLDAISYYVCKKGATTGYGDKTGLVIRICNLDSTGRSKKECSLYSVTYYPTHAKTGIKVFINGQDFSQVTRETAKQLAKDAKMQFSESDLDKFAKGESNSVLKSSNAYRWSIEESQGTMLLSFQKNNVKVDYGK